MSKKTLTIIALLVALVAMILCMQFRPSFGGWFGCRIAAAVLSLWVGFWTFTIGEIASGVQEIKNEVSTYKTEKFKHGFFGQQYALIGWMLGWLVIGQIMISFYISDL